MPDFDDPFKSPESTVVRPRPGAGRRAGGEPPPRQAPGSAPVESVSAAAIESLGIGLSPLVRAASALLMLTGQLRGTLAGPDIPTLRRYALDEIRRFEDRARAGGVQNEVVLAARYALCSGLDEAVLSTPWGAQSEWAQQTLLVALHREAWGGEKFFEMLDRISSDPKRHIDLMELQYLCLAFGFAGKYQVADRGQSRLSDIQHDLYRRIRDYRGVPPTELSLRWKGLEDRRNPLIRYVPWWVVGAAALALLAIGYTTFWGLLAQASTPVTEAFNAVESSRGATKRAPADGALLKQLLDPQIQRGEVSVDVRPEGALITLLKDDQFGSGRAEFNRAYEPTLKAIADALDKVPGHVEVLGHTDDQPVRAGMFENNDALSKGRAADVTEILRRFATKSPRGRFEAIGKGESKRYKPDDVDYRKKNRRIEIRLGGF